MINILLDFFKAENIRLVEIYEKFCSKFKINEEVKIDLNLKLISSGFH